jgi:hypothetical protein
VQRERFLIPAHGPDVVAVAAAIEAITVLCEKHDGDALICVPALKHAENTILKHVWSERQIKQLAQGKTLRIADKHKVDMCSPFTLKNHYGIPVILGLFASKDMIEKLEKLSWGVALVIVPWIPEDKEAWEKKYAPKVLSFTKKEV